MCCGAEVGFQRRDLEWSIAGGLEEYKQAVYYVNIYLYIVSNLRYPQILMNKSQWTNPVVSTVKTRISNETQAENEESNKFNSSFTENAKV